MLCRLSKLSETKSQSADAASLDDHSIHHVIKTVAALPEKFHGNITFSINDSQIWTIARNLITLVLLSVVDDFEVAVEAITHLSYSAYIRDDHTRLINTHVLPIVRSAVEEGQSSDTKVITKQIKSPNGETIVNVTLKSQRWLELYLVLTTTHNLAKAKDNRRTVREGLEDDQDYLLWRTRHPKRRIGLLRYLQRGLVLPFSAQPLRFNVPNP